MALYAKTQNRPVKEGQFIQEMILGNYIDIKSNWQSIQSETSYWKINTNSDVIEYGMIPEFVSSQNMINDNQIGMRIQNLGKKQVKGAAEIVQTELTPIIEEANNILNGLGIIGDLTLSNKHIKTTFNWNDIKNSLSVSVIKLELISELISEYNTHGTIERRVLDLYESIKG